MALHPDTPEVSHGPGGRDEPCVEELVCVLLDDCSNPEVDLADWQTQMLEDAGQTREEVAARLKELKWKTGTVSDSPPCVAPEIRQWFIRMNDWDSFEGHRNSLREFIPAQLGTATDGLREERTRYLVLQAARVFAPLALDAAGLEKEAEALRAIADGESFKAIRGACESAADDAAAAAATAAYAAAAAAYAAAEAAAEASAYGAEAAAEASHAAASAAFHAAVYDDGAVVVLAALETTKGLMEISSQ